MEKRLPAYRATNHNSFSAFDQNKTSSFFKPIIQSKLSINQPNDIYEQEADAMADKVMRMPDVSMNNNSFFRPAILSLQRKCAHCEEEEMQMQRKEANSNEQIVNPPTENYISSLDGKGRSLAPDEKNFFEPRFGYDFSNVQLHTNTDANNSAKNINALAYTTGNNIVFNEGQYAPKTENGKKLIAHELTHVVQQQKDLKTIHRWAISGNTAKVNEENDTLWNLALHLKVSPFNWVCIVPINMKTESNPHQPSDFNEHYERYLQIGDTFDISNLTAKRGETLKVFLFDEKADTMNVNLVKSFYPGIVQSGSDPDTDIESKSQDGKTPIQEYLIFGHAGGDTMFGGAASFTPNGFNPNDPLPTFNLAQAWLLPRRCWFTGNAKARAVGCDSDQWGNDFASNYLRKGAVIIATTKSVRPTCSAPVYNPTTNSCTSYDGLEFASTFVAHIGRTLDGPFASASDFHASKFWKIISGKL